MRKKWKSASVRKFFNHFLRSKWGEKTSHKRKIENAIRNRRVETSYSDGHKKNILEETIGVESFDTLKLEYLSVEAKALVILLQHGFTFKELESFFKLSHEELLKKLNYLGERETEVEREISRVERKPRRWKRRWDAYLPKPSAAYAYHKALKDKKDRVKDRPFLLLDEVPLKDPSIDRV